MDENGRLLLSEEQLNLINCSIVENISKFIPEKIDTHLKKFWPNDKLNTELSFTRIKQETEHFIYSNNKL